MSAWQLVNAWSGLDADAVEGTLRFEPKATGDFRLFWSAGHGFGELVRQDGVRVARRSVAKAPALHRRTRLFRTACFGAFKTQAEIMAAPGAWLPESFTNIGNFVELFVHRQFGTYMINSLVVSAFAVVTNVLFGSMAGYALTKLPFKGSRLVFGSVLVAMMVPYIALFVPQFFIIVQMRLVNTLAAIILPIAVMPIAVFVMRQFAQSIPDDLLEAARLDGAGELRIFLGIFLPLLGPAIATVAIITFLNSWNYFLWPLIVAQDQSSYTLPVGLAVASQAANSTDYGLLLAGAIVVLFPVLVLFLFLQKYFVRGIAVTGLK